MSKFLKHGHVILLYGHIENQFLGAQSCKKLPETRYVTESKILREISGVDIVLHK